jgi:hypothetical protein
MMRRLMPQSLTPPPEVGAPDRRVEQRRHRARVVREVAVHLEHVRVVALERPAEAREVGAAEAFLSLAVQDVQPGALGREPVGDLSGAVR